MQVLELKYQVPIDNNSPVTRVTQTLSYITKQLKEVKHKYKNFKSARIFLDFPDDDIVSVIMTALIGIGVPSNKIYVSYADIEENQYVIRVIT